jgi:phosphatidylethanolamine-binding protein (PEBP) family uncharacterized protein
MAYRSAFPILLAVLCVSPACSATFTLSSPAIGKSGAYPIEFTCDGERASPPLAWSNAPAGTRSFALTMHHIPGPGDKHVYLVVYNIPASTTNLAKNVHDVGVWGVNTVNGQPEYTPPCSKGPGAKTYTLTAYALSAEPTISFPAGRVTMDMLLDKIKDKTLATSAIDVTYSRVGTSDRPGSRSGPRPPQELERTLSTLTLSAEQKQKVEVLIQQYGDQQRRLREDLLQQLKSALDPDQYAKVEESMRQPPPPPGPRQ